MTRVDLFPLEDSKELLRKLVLIPSSSVDDKQQITRFIIDYLERLRFNCRVLGPSDAPAIIASRGTGAGLLLSGHLDTVPIGNSWSVAQGEIREDVLYGRGAADMKGGCAAILMAAGEISRTDTSLSIAFTTDEETTMLGAELLSKEREMSSARAIVVCEPTSLTIGLREKGLLQLRLATAGRSAHAAMPQQGENAIHKMLAALARLEPLSRNRIGASDKMTLNVDFIRGGSKVNVLPDICEAEIDIRTPPSMKTEEALSIVSERLSGADCELSVINRLEPISIPADVRTVKLLRRIVRSAGTSDMAYASEMIKYIRVNENLVAFGPGDPGQAHRADEHIDLKEVSMAASVYARLAFHLREI